MSQSLSKVFSAREYLKTYYPSDFDQAQLLSAIDLVESGMKAQNNVFDMRDLFLETGLSSEEIENAAILNFLRRVSLHLLQAFPHGRVTLLDIGGGPTVYQHIPLCLNVSSIIHGEFSSENRAEIQAYLSGEETAYHWEAYFSVVRQLLSHDQSYQMLLHSQGKDKNPAVRERADRIKKILFSEDAAPFEDRLVTVLAKNIVPCDVFVPSLEFGENKDVSVALRENTSDGLPDIISAHFLIESATENLLQWEKGVRHLIQKLRPGGYYLMTAIRNASWYRVGSEKVAAVSVNEKRIKKFLEEHGIVIEDMQVLKGSDQGNHGYDGMIFVLGRKIRP